MVKKKGDGSSKKVKVKIIKSNLPRTMKFATEREIAMDFAVKIYKEFDKMLKSIVLFGSSAKKVSTESSDIDIIVIIDDVSINWDNTLISWYRGELAEIIKKNPYRKSLHVNTVKLSTWWKDLTRGDPVLVNILRYGDTLIDNGGFFDPLKVLLKEGKIKSTPEAIYTLLQRAPTHLARTRASLLAAIDGLYWAMVDSAHAALIAGNVMPPSPEHIPEILRREYVNKGLLNKKFASDYEALHAIAKDIVHGKIVDFRGSEIDGWIIKADAFVGEMARLVDDLLDKRRG